MKSTETEQEKYDKASNRLKTRLQEMEITRSSYYQLWKLIELMVEENFDSYESGVLNMRIPLSANKIEFALGSQWSLINISVEAEQPGVDDIDVEISKYAIEYFIDKELIQAEIKRFRYDKAKYGHGFIRVAPYCKYNFDDLWSQYMNWDSNIKQSKMKKEWHLGMKNLRIRDVWMDDALTSRDASDCFYREIITWEEYLINYTKTDPEEYAKDPNSVELKPKDKYVNVDKVRPKTVFDKSPKYGWKSPQHKNSVEIYHYENKVTGRYEILANGDHVIYMGKLQNPDGELSVHGCQHYIDTSRHFGKGIVEKSLPTDTAIGYLLKLMMDDARVTNARFLGMWWDNTLEDAIYIEEWEINELKFSWEIDQMKQIDFRSNIQSTLPLYQALKEQNIEDSGVDMRSSIWGTAFEVWVIQQRQSERVGSVLQDEQITMDAVFTQYARVILYWGPKLLSKVSWTFKVKVKGKKYIKSDWENKARFEEYPWWFDRFPITDLKRKPEDIRVKVDTPATQSVLKAVDIDTLPKMMNALLTAKQLYPDLKIWDGQWVVKKIESLNWIDVEGEWMKTRLDVIREESTEMITTVNNVANLFTWTTADENTNTQWWWIPVLPGPTNQGQGNVWAGGNLPEGTGPAPQ